MNGTKESRRGSLARAHRGSSPRRAVVTGGAGFIGSHLVEALVERGDQVTCIERPGAPRNWIADLPIRYTDCGLGAVETLAEACGEADVVFHLAGLTSARTPEEFFTVNTEGTEHVLQAACRGSGAPPSVILMSSLAACGPCRNGAPLSPDSAPEPLSCYGRSKLQAEILMHEYADRVPGTVVRLPAVYGPRDRAVLTFFQLVRRRVALTVGSWEREVNMIYVKDVVQGLLAAAAAPNAAGRTYVLAHPERLSWRSFAAAVGEALDRRPILVSLPRAAAAMIAVSAEFAARLRNRAALLNRDRVRELTQASWRCDASRAFREIGFRPHYPLRRGLSETAAWYREEQWL